MLNVERYLARPWSADSYNCFELLREFYKNELGIVIPASGISATDDDVITDAFLNHPLRKSFKRIESPVNFCVIGMRKENSEDESHCGIYLDYPDGCRVLHNVNGSGVRLDMVSRLGWLKLVICGFYEYL
jgi:hypothetical protein